MLGNPRSDIGRVYKSSQRFARPEGLVEMATIGSETMCTILYTCRVARKGHPGPASERASGLCTNRTREAEDLPGGQPREGGPCVQFCTHAGFLWWDLMGVLVVGEMGRPCMPKCSLWLVQTHEEALGPGGDPCVQICTQEGVLGWDGPAWSLDEPERPIWERPMCTSVYT